MSGRTVLAASLALGLFATSAFADIPSPANWSIPSHVNLVGSSGGVPAPAGRFEIIARDIANNPIPGADVVLDLSGVPDMHFCPDQADPAFTVRCLQRTVGKHTDAEGRVTFVIAGGGNGPAGSVTGSARVYGDGVLLTGSGFSVGAFDLDGAGGVAGNDLSMWLEDFGDHPNTQRGDFDGLPGMGGNDLSVLISAFGSGEQIESCTNVCP